MERLAWVEILDRHGEVASRHPVHAWPVRVGRSYQSDVVLDDPHAAAHHAEIRPAGEPGQYEFRCLETLNGLRLKGHRGKKSEALVSGHEVVRIGNTPLRVRPLDFPVDQEMVLPRAAWLQRWIGLVVATLVFTLMFSLKQWHEYTRAEPYAILVAPLLSNVPAFVLWAGVCSLIGRVVVGRARFIAHAVVALLVVSAVNLIGTVGPYAEFAFDAYWLDELQGGLMFAVVAVAAYIHLRLVSRMSRRKVGLIVAGLVGLVIGYAYLDEAWSEDKQLGRMSYSRELGPASLLLVQPQAPEAFLDAAAKLKEKADK